MLTGLHTRALGDGALNYGTFARTARQRSCSYTYFVEREPPPHPHCRTPVLVKNVLYLSPYRGQERQGYIRAEQRGIRRHGVTNDSIYRAKDDRKALIDRLSARRL